MLGNISINVDSLKEPRGFLKCVQTLLSMLVFSLYVSTAFEVHYSLKCEDGNKQLHILKLHYPFEYDLSTQKISFVKCSTNPTPNLTFIITPKSPSLSKFHVFMSVVPFLYGLACVVYFVFFELDITQPGADRHQVLFYTVDIGVSLVTVFLGLIACFCAMSVSSNLGSYAKIEHFKKQMHDMCSGKDQCSLDNHFNQSNMIASILFQLANLGVWTFSLYMMWKDQAWKTVTTIPYDNDPTNVVAAAPGATTTQAYSAAYGNDYEYTYSN